MRITRGCLSIIILLALSLSGLAQAGRAASPATQRNAAIPAPETVLGFQVGEERKLADPRILKQQGDAEALANNLIQSGKTVVVITCSIHSTEVGGTFTATELAYRLTSENSDFIKNILANTIILLVPSLNPDGTDI